MDYEEKYNAALERAAKLRVQNPFDTVGQMVEHIFPELKENENEKIRKDILCYFEHYAHDIKDADAQKWIAWLKEQKTEEVKEVVFSPAIGCDIDSAARQAIEKQKVSGKDIVLAFNGAYIPVSGKTADDVVNEYYSWIKNQGEQTNPYSGISFEYNGHTWGMCARDNGVDILLDKQLFKHLEKQGEQPTDKVETKFKVGDWISGYYTNYKVTAIHSKGYMVEGTDGTKINILFENEKFHHLWTIQDAKDGDVLATEDGRPFIIRCMVESKNDIPSAYCGINARPIEAFIITGYSPGTSKWTNSKVHPATKEQRDLLFQKMKEAGYDWDSVKKKLKKVESKTSLL